MITFDPESSVAPYAQIRDQVVEGITGGELCAGARLPTVRGLAAELGLAVNTVAKAYKQLEAEGHVVTRGRNGTVVLPCRVGVRGAPVVGGGAGGSGEVHVAAGNLARAAQRQGLSLSETIGLLRQLW